MHSGTTNSKTAAAMPSARKSQSRGGVSCGCRPRSGRPLDMGSAPHLQRPNGASNAGMLSGGLGDCNPVLVAVGDEVTADLVDVEAADRLVVLVVAYEREGRLTPRRARL